MCVCRADRIFSSIQFLKNYFDPVYSCGKAPLRQSISRSPIYMYLKLNYLCQLWLCWSAGTRTSSSSYSAFSLKSFLSIDFESIQRLKERTREPFNVRLFISDKVFNFQLVFFFLFKKQIRSWIVKNGRFRERCRTCVWALSGRWRRGNRRWSTVTSPAPTCRKSRQKAADSKRRSLSTASRIFSSSAMKAVPPNFK